MLGHPVRGLAINNVCIYVAILDPTPIADVICLCHPNSRSTNPKHGYDHGIKSKICLKLADDRVVSVEGTFKDGLLVSLLLVGTGPCRVYHLLLNQGFVCIDLGDPPADWPVLIDKIPRPVGFVDCSLRGPLAYLLARQLGRKMSTKPHCTVHFVT